MPSTGHVPAIVVSLC